MQSGATLIESTATLLLLCFLAIAGLESAHWLLLRQYLNTALLDTGRSLATLAAQPQHITPLFKHHLQQHPAWAFSPSDHWEIYTYTLAPTPASFNYQALQYQQGNTRIFDQNTLVLRLTYGHRPLSPVLRHFVRLALAHSSNNQSYYQQGLIPIQTEIRIAMQSDTTQATASAQASNSTSQTTTPHTVPLPSMPTYSSPSSLGSWLPPSNEQTTPSWQCHGSFCCEAPP